eukprot:symbB.v1.2.041689.t1/scaffold8506.1/size6082/1
MKVVIDVCRITSATLKMEGLDSLQDLKALLSEMTGIRVSDMELKFHSPVGPQPEASDTSTLKDLGATGDDDFKVFLKKTSDEVWKIANTIREKQDICRRNDEVNDFVEANTRTIITKNGIFFTSHGLHEEEAEPESTGYSGDVASSSLEAPDAVDEHADLKMRLELMALGDAQLLLATREEEVKLIKRRLAVLKKEKKGEDITINLLQPSGRHVPHVVKPKDTVLKVKRSISETLNMGDPHEIRLVHGTDEMKNAKTMAGYSVGDGDVIAIILSIAGGGKGMKVKQENFMKLAKRMEAQSYMTKSAGTTVDCVKKTNDACNALMNMCDTNAKQSIRFLLEQNTQESIEKSMEAYGSSNNKDVRLHDCAEALFEALITPIKNEMASYTGAIE